MTPETKQDVYRLFQAGSTTGELSRQFGVSRQRIHQLTKKAGLIGGRKVAPSKSAMKRAASDTKFVAKWGCSRSEWRELRRMSKDWYETPMGRFMTQRSNAGKRGVEWRLTLWEWWNIWRESGKWDLRGKMIGQYVMARVGDQGPYSVDNVYITTSSENCRDGRLGACRNA